MNRREFLKTSLIITSGIFVPKSVISAEERITKTYSSEQITESMMADEFLRLMNREKKVLERIIPNKDKIEINKKLFNAGYNSNNNIIDSKHWEWRFFVYDESEEGVLKKVTIDEYSKRYITPIVLGFRDEILNILKLPQNKLISIGYNEKTIKRHWYSDKYNNFCVSVFKDYYPPFDTYIRRFDMIFLKVQ